MQQVAEAPRFFTKWGMDKAGNYIPQMVKIREHQRTAEPAKATSSWASWGTGKGTGKHTGEGSEPQLNLYR